MTSLSYWIDAAKALYHYMFDDDKKTTRSFDSSNTNVWHFHPIAFVEQLKLVTGRSWHEPVDNPMLCLYSQNGKIKKPWHGSFGKKIRDGVRNHTGMDLFTLPGTKVYASVKGKVVRSEVNKSMYGELIVIKVIDKETFKNKKKENFTLKYSNKGELNNLNFDFNGDFYLMYAHLKERKVKIGTIVHAGDIIGLSGTSGKNGVPFNTCNPHVHFEIMNIPRGGGLNKKCNPGIYLSFKDVDDLTQKDIDLQEKARTQKKYQKQ